MEDAVPGSFAFNPNGFHHSLAGFGTVSGVDVDVLAPQTFGAVVGESCPGDVCAALITAKIFYASLEFGVHGTFISCSCCEIMRSILPMGY
jgi:hypothetical protein